MSQASFAVAITADDKTAKGVASAEKRIGLIPKHTSAVNKSQARALQDSMARSGRGMIRTLGAVEQAGARAFGNRSLTSGFASRLSAVRQAAAATGEGFGEAATAGGVLEGAMAGIGVVAGATIGILGAAAYAAFKLTDGWAKGAAQIGRTADIIGVAKKEMQEFAAAAERMGVDPGAATGGLGGLSQTLNDARYGRNAGALAVLGKLGVKMKLNSDGTVDVAAMLPALADAMRRQNSSGRRTMAHGLGISDALIPVLSQGAGALSADMADAGQHSAIITDEDAATGARIQRKGVMVSQIAGQGMNAVGRTAAGVAETGYDAVLSGATSLSDAFSGGGGGRAAAQIDRGGAAVERGGRAIERAAAGLTPAAIAAARHSQARYGVRASLELAQYGQESQFGRHMPAGSNNPFGIKAHGNQPYVLARTREVDRFGRSYYTMAKFRKFASLDEAFDEHARLLSTRRYARVRSAGSADAAADAVQASGYATDPHYARGLKTLIHRHGLDRYDAPGSIPVKVEVEMRGAPPGTRTRVTAGRGSAPAVSHAMQH